MESFSFKENILIRSVVSILFGCAALVVAVGAFSKAVEPEGGILFILPGILALIVTVALFWFFIASYNSRQFVTVTPEQIIVKSQARGTKNIYWYNLAHISETALALEKMRGLMPVIEVMISYYFLIPLPSNNEKRSLLNLEANDGTKVSLREHLVYPHRLDQLRQAAYLYAPTLSRTQLILKSNIQN